MTYVIKRKPLFGGHKAVYLKSGTAPRDWMYTELINDADHFDSHSAVLKFAVKTLDAVLGDDELSIVEVTEKTSYRVSKPDSNGTRWQVRDGVTWFRTKCSRTFHKHVDVQVVLDSMVQLKRYDDVAILADIAASPGTSTLTEK